MIKTFPMGKYVRTLVLITICLGFLPSCALLGARVDYGFSLDITGKVVDESSHAQLKDVELVYIPGYVDAAVPYEEIIGHSSDEGAIAGKHLHRFGCRRSWLQQQRGIKPDVWVTLFLRKEGYESVHFHYSLFKMPRAGIVTPISLGEVSMRRTAAQ
jgi:hypothetical protein